MKRNRWIKITLLLISVLALVVSESSYAGEVRGVADKTITSGLILTMTGPGASILGALGAAGGARNFFQHVNEQGGINGRKVKVILHDDRFTIPGAMAGFKKLVYRDHVLTLFLPGTGQTVALTSQIQKEKVPAMTAGLSDTLITPVDQKRYIFLPCAGYQDQIVVVIDYIMNDLKAKDPKIAMVTLEIEYGKVGLAAAKKRLRHYGLDLVTVEKLSFGAVDASTPVLNIRKVKADYVIVHLDATTGISFLRDAKKYGLAARMMGDYYSCDQDLVKASGSAAKNYIACHTFNSWYDETPAMNTLRKVTLRYQPKGPKTRNRYYVQGWVMSMIFAEGMKRAGRDLTPETMIKALESLKDFNTNGLSGPISYTSTNHKAGEYCRLFKADVEKGRMVPISGWRKPER